MNAFEIEEAISSLAQQPFDAAEFPFLFLQAFGAKDTTLRRLRSGDTNKSDVGGVLQTTNIHIKVSLPGAVTETMGQLKASPGTSRAKAKFILATDGVDFQAEDLNSGEVIVCDFSRFPEFFGFFLPLAGISTVKQIRESSFDIKATGRLNRLYIELLKDNPEWSTSARRPEMNHFMARLIFCFFAEDTDIFTKETLFTSTVEQMTSKAPTETHVVIEGVFKAMNTRPEDRADTDVPRWANVFPYVNGGLFSGSTKVPVFSKIARSYLLHIGGLDWRKINPDIFGSMIQAVADDDERGSLGMHYTSVPNILKVLNPLFLDDLREKLEEAGDNSRKLLNLRSRMSRIRVFDPACGSGNFLVIAYKQIREIEAEINRRRGEPERRTEVPLTNFRGIELRDFPAEIARLALIIAEYQCDVLYRGQKEALAEFLPLDSKNWVTCGNALELDWLSVCPPTGTGVRLRSDDLFRSPLDQAEIDFDNEGGETYICGNPPYLGSKWQSEKQKSELQTIFGNRTRSWKSLDYVAGWFMKAADYGQYTDSAVAFVATNSICQGVQVPILWPLISKTGHEIHFAHTSFKWANLASNNAGVTVAIVGLAKDRSAPKRLYSLQEGGATIVKEAANINYYLVDGPNIDILPSKMSISNCAYMDLGNMPKDGGNLLLTFDEAQKAMEADPTVAPFVYDFVGSQEFVKGIVRRCLWIEDGQAEVAVRSSFIASRLQGVRSMRMESDAESTRAYADRPHRFKQIQGRGERYSIVVPKVTSETRPYLPVGLLSSHSIVSDNAFAMYDAPLWNLSLIASRLHLVWVATVCGKLETRYRYSNTLGWNTFPVPDLTEKNKTDLTRCAEDILLAREAHFPATIADLYDPEEMPADLKAAHDRNDEVLEAIYIGRRFRNDTERLEKLFELYTKMTSGKPTKSGNIKMKA
ncbi:class I SAM-dependent DNA methyltransferase [Rhizobium ruizarguesonis]|uniref:class I SAM-dependent DNA methyltransferase n=1 Tax=Rhizobium leguminosarum TaxID=384 RepID=UPI001C96A9B1|nr:DNA methyltransferase [Rhizobium leguminosarum]MBY5820029.1 class I SAM-dependent DNA methyltransferase [Rhizobium leguminosarum]